MNVYVFINANVQVPVLYRQSFRISCGQYYWQRKSIIFLFITGSYQHLVEIYDNENKRDGDFFQSI